MSQPSKNGLSRKNPKTAPAMPFSTRNPVSAGRSRVAAETVALCRWRTQPRHCQPGGLKVHKTQGGPAPWSMTGDIRHCMDHGATSTRRVLRQHGHPHIIDSTAPPHPLHWPSARSGPLRPSPTCWLDSTKTSVQEIQNAISVPGQTIQQNQTTHARP
ncbi:hypothetical protein Micbo1qcDRAFT_17326 [Microdochium bolleyi]|uniref:Uncharacterized protein n=1 Tax=Microdochium bolleyi TaxID=196109 RepID=A0A136IU00_9PEZI|nr:hypothetical protein Micbo1qcDRAFT_17326 [Microdochium bolleyi]